jgi:hypothetical protein
MGLFVLLALASNLAGCGFTLAPPGFVREHRHAVCRGALDWNSHRRFSFTIDTYDRLPPDSARVKLFRWSHGGSVEEPRLMPFDNLAAASESYAAPETPGSPGALEAPADDGPPGEPLKNADDAANQDGGPANPGSLEILPPPPAPPSEGEDSGFPPLYDAAENIADEALSSGWEDTPAMPLVSISFSENLNESEDERARNGPECSVPSVEVPQE